MISRRTKAFRQLLQTLPKDIQQQARIAYHLFEQDPYHPSLFFKQVDPKRSLYSVRIGLHYRALGVKQGNRIAWVWIGSHDEYDKLLN